MRTYKIGEKVRIKKTGQEGNGKIEGSNHGYPKGRAIKITGVANNPQYENIYNTTDDAGCCWSVYGFEIGPTMATRADVEKELADAREAVTAAEAKVAYMAEAGSEEFDETEFKVYQALRVIEKGGGTTFERARAIAKLVAQ